MSRTILLKALASRSVNSSLKPGATAHSYDYHPAPVSRPPSSRMFRLRRTLTLVLAIILIVPSTASAVVLVTPSGTPYDDQLTRWAYESFVPTYPGKVTLSFTPCPYWGPDAEGCAGGTSLWITAHGNTRHDVLMHELGHIFDDNVLTDLDRAAFMRLWRVPRHPGATVSDDWDYGADHVGDMLWNGQMPAAEWFAEGYRLCALHRHWNADIARRVFARDWGYGESSVPGYAYDYPASWSMWATPDGSSPPRRKQRWAIRSQRATCKLIRAAGIFRPGSSPS